MSRCILHATPIAPVPNDPNSPSRHNTPYQRRSPKSLSEPPVKSVHTSYILRAPDDSNIVDDSGDDESEYYINDREYQPRGGVAPACVTCTHAFGFISIDPITYALGTESGMTSKSVALDGYDVSALRKAAFSEYLISNSFLSLFCFVLFSLLSQRWHDSYVFCILGRLLDENLSNSPDTESLGSVDDHDEHGGDEYPSLVRQQEQQHHGSSQDVSADTSRLDRLACEGV